MERERREKKREKAWRMRRLTARRVNMKIWHKWERINKEERIKKRKNKESHVFFSRCFFFLNRNKEIKTKETRYFPKKRLKT